MLQYPVISPYVIELWGFKIRWYGVMYLLSFIGTYLVARYLLRTKRFIQMHITEAELSDLYFSLILGVILGGRLGYVLFYNFSYYIYHPFSVFAVWEGGMSLHGGLIGVLFAAWLFVRKRNVALYDLLALLAIVTPIGISLGRIGNFINGELYGYPSNVAWCMVFPTVSLCRHPTQIYHFLLEGLTLLAIMWIAKNYASITNKMLCGIFLLSYGALRFFVEFFKESERFLGLITMSQILCIPMILIGLWLVWKKDHRGPLVYTA